MTIYGRVYNPYQQIDRQITSAKEVAEILMTCEFQVPDLLYRVAHEDDIPHLYFRDAGMGSYTIIKFPKNIVKLLREMESANRVDPFLKFAEGYSKNIENWAK